MAGETMLTICGNLTADPELRTLSTGSTVANFTIASTPRTFNRQSGQWEDGQALFLRCSAWNDMASNIAQSLAKGMRVIARGMLSQRSYQAQDGTNRTIVEMTVDEIGPSLRHAKAAVVKTGNTGRTQGGHQGGYQGGAAHTQPTATPTGPAAPDEDPWATDTPATYGAPDGFTPAGDDPAF